MRGRRRRARTGGHLLAWRLHPGRVGRARARRAQDRGPGDCIDLEGRNSESRMQNAETKYQSHSEFGILNSKMTDTVRPRIDRYLSETGLAARGAKVVPLTGDAF